MPIVQLLHRKIRGGKFAIPPEYDGEIPPGIGLRARKRNIKAIAASLTLLKGRQKSPPIDLAKFTARVNIES